jgi:hypothetical protein
VIHAIHIEGELQNIMFIRYEVFPVTIFSGQAVLIRHPQEKQLPPWIIPNQPDIHPNDLVVQSLVNFFGDVFDPRSMIIHSTSWRYEQQGNQLLLTYLAVLPQGHWLDSWLTTKRISIEPIAVGAIQYGDHLFPPSPIERHHVLAHALDHLASLSTYDPGIQAVLEPEWGEVLRLRSPKVAGYLRNCAVPV